MVYITLENPTHCLRVGLEEKDRPKRAHKARPDENDGEGGSIAQVYLVWVLGVL